MAMAMMAMPWSRRIASGRIMSRVGGASRPLIAATSPAFSKSDIIIIFRQFSNSGPTRPPYISARRRRYNQSEEAVNELVMQRLQNEHSQFDQQGSFAQHLKRQHEAWSQFETQFELKKATGLVDPNVLLRQIPTFIADFHRHAAYPPLASSLFHKMIHMCKLLALKAPESVVDVALSILEDMKKYGVNPDVVTYCSLLSVLAECGRSNRGLFSTFLSIYSEAIHEMQIIPNNFFFGTAMRGFLVFRLYKEGLHAFYELKKLCPTPPQTLTWNCVLRLCHFGTSKQESLDAAIALFNSMTHPTDDSGELLPIDPESRPNEYTVNIFLDLLLQSGCTQEQFDEALSSMGPFAANWAPGVAAVVLKACKMFEDVPRAERVFDACRRKGSLNLVVCNKMLSIYMQSENYHRKARELYDQMVTQQSRGLPRPDTATHIIMRDIAALQREMHSKSAAEESQELQPRATPNDTTTSSPLFPQSAKLVQSDTQ